MPQMDVGRFHAFEVGLDFVSLARANNGRREQEEPAQCACLSTKQTMYFAASKPCIRDLFLADSMS